MGRKEAGVVVDPLPGVDSSVARPFLPARWRLNVSVEKWKI